MQPLSPALADFIESGVSTFVAGRDAQLRGHCLRGFGARVEQGGRGVTVFVPRALCDDLRACFEDNGRIAVTFSRPIDHRTLQLKGRVLELREADAEDDVLQRHYMAGFVEQLYCVGLPRALSRRLRCAPALAVRFAVEALFDQTPGPGAGGAMPGGEA